MPVVAKTLKPAQTPLAFRLIQWLEASEADKKASGLVEFDYLAASIIYIADARASKGEVLDDKSQAIKEPAEALPKYAKMWLSTKKQKFEPALEKTKAEFTSQGSEFYNKSEYSHPVVNAAYQELLSISWRMMQCLMKDVSISYKDYKKSFLEAYRLVDSVVGG